MGWKAQHITQGYQSFHFPIGSRAAVLAKEENL